MTVDVRDWLAVGILTVAAVYAYGLLVMLAMSSEWAERALGALIGLAWIAAPAAAVTWSIAWLT